ncbi:cinnamoyl-CoA reductase 1-like isoform X1 [Rhododendron vialii]|uniref:cinnamoyl-CoA reductase 1-like isoform X1 n=1 Tax=Rhododendron vialii TaxID=182163 RepID=UPI00265F3E30|nr:cinnamoyl-CoA reductase 1-like isoform X1 [Rhododendron vialii]
MERKEEERVCVTGAGGYISSWVVKLLLSKGYVVHGTVRDPRDEKKNGHLKKLEKASENLHLFKADLFDYEGLYAAIAGCTGVLHVASPVPSDNPSINPEVELVEPAITGTQNVLNACLKARVKKVVVVSSVAAVMVNPNWPKGQPMDENSWSDTEFCKSAKMWYPFGKTIAESETLEFGIRNELNIVTICPSLVIGPNLQSSLNLSSSILLSYLKGEINTMNCRVQQLVDVRDFAEALLLLYEKPEAEGRYICSSYTIRPEVLVEKLKAMFPHYNYPEIFIEEKGGPFDFNCKKLLDFGWKYRPLEESIVDAVKNFEESGLLVGK